jgi:thioredoxin-like negative regulator of GroEL
LVFGLLERVQAQGAALTVTEVDITQHPDIVQQHGILATPAVAIDGQLEFSGVPSERQLLARLRARGLVLADTPEPEASPPGFLGRLHGLFRGNFGG